MKTTFLFVNNAYGYFILLIITKESKFNVNSLVDRTFTYD